MYLAAWDNCVLQWQVELLLALLAREQSQLCTRSHMLVRERAHAHTHTQRHELSSTHTYSCMYTHKHAYTHPAEKYPFLSQGSLFALL